MLDKPGKVKKSRNSPVKKTYIFSGRSTKRQLQKDPANSTWQ